MPTILFVCCFLDFEHVTSSRQRKRKHQSLSLLPALSASPITHDRHVAILLNAELSCSLIAYRRRIQCRLFSHFFKQKYFQSDYISLFFLSKTNRASSLQVCKVSFSRILDSVSILLSNNIYKHILKDIRWIGKLFFSKKSNWIITRVLKPCTQICTVKCIKWP